MDFDFTSEQDELRGLTRQILADISTHEHLRELESSGVGFDRQLWDKLVETGVLSASVSEDHGGGGLGLLGVASVLEEVGSHNAMVPAFSVLLAAFAFEHSESPLAGEMLRRLSEGAVVGLAVVEARGDIEAPSTKLIADGSGLKLSGQKSLCEYFDHADEVLVWATDERSSAPVLVLVDKSDLVGSEVLTQMKWSASSVSATGAQVGPDAVVLSGAGARAWLDAYLACLCSIGVGVAQRALDLTAEYAKTRHQFDKPIGAFQAVGQRAADAYIDAEAIRLTARQAVWRLSEGLDAHREVLIAKYWLAEGGSRLALAAQHIHGGVGVDRDYPLHRCFFWLKYLELLGGAASTYLLKLSTALAG